MDLANVTVTEYAVGAEEENEVVTVLGGSSLSDKSFNMVEKAVSLHA